MIAIKTFFWQPSLVLTLTWLLGSYPPTQTNAIALALPKTIPDLQASSGNARASKNAATNFRLPPKGAPGKRSEGAGSRGICPTVDVGITALIPPTNIGLTISEHPIFWFYIPYGADLEKTADFVLLDDRENIIYKTRLQFVGAAGVASVALPATAPALELDKKYQWVLSYICNADNSAENVVVRGYVERVALSPEATQQLRAAKTPEERLVVYAQNGFWYDTITLLGELLLAEPDKFQADWEALLRLPVIGLEEIATEPIVEQKVGN